MSLGCFCTDGRHGAQSCEDDGTYAACECTGMPAGDSGTADPDAGGGLDSGTPTTDAGLDSGGEPPPDAGSDGLSIVRTAPIGAIVHVRDVLMIQLAVRGPADRVELLLDGAVLADLVPPYAYGWDTRTVIEGAHEIVAVARRGSTEVRTPPLDVVVDRTSPHIRSRTPGTADLDVWLGDPIEIVFSEPLLPATLTDAAIVVGAGDVVGLPVSLDLAPDRTTLSVRLEAAPPLPASIRVSTTGAATDFAGNPTLVEVFTFAAPAWVRAGYTVEEPATENPNSASMAVNRDGAMCAAWVSAMAGFRVTCFDGTGWRLMGGDLRVDLTRSVASSMIRVDSMGRPVVAWLEVLSGMPSVLVVRRWDGTAWVDLGTPFPTVLDQRLSMNAADEPVVTVFSADNTLEVRRRTPAGWAPIGTPLTTPTAPFSVALGTAGAPVVVFAGTGCLAHRWDGSGWQALGSTIGCPTFCSCGSAEVSVGPDDLPVVVVRQSSSNNVNVFRWTGGAWQTLGFFPSNTDVFGVRVGEDGAPVVAYRSTATGMLGVQVQRYAGTPGWQSLGFFPSATSPVLDLYAGRVPALLFRQGIDWEGYRHNGL